MRFESIFNKTPLGEKIMQNLMTNEEDPQYILLYLRDFIYMRKFPYTKDQYGVSRKSFATVTITKIETDFSYFFLLGVRVCPIELYRTLHFI